MGESGYSQAGVERRSAESAGGMNPFVCDDLPMQNTQRRITKVTCSVSIFRSPDNPVVVKARSNRSRIEGGGRVVKGSLDRLSERKQASCR